LREREPALRRVELGGGHPEVEDDALKRDGAQGLQDFRRIAEATVHERDAVPELGEALARRVYRARISIDSHQAAVRGRCLQNEARMTSTADRRVAIHAPGARPYIM